MKKIFILFATGILLMTPAYADKIITVNSVKIKLFDDFRYSIVYDGDVVVNSQGKKVVLKPDHTWEYAQDMISITYREGRGDKFWFSDNGRWGVVKTYKDPDGYTFKEVSLIEENGRTKVRGRLINNIKQDYASLTFNLMVFDIRAGGYIPAGELTITNLNGEDESRFSGTINIKKERIEDYYFELKSAVPAVKQIEKIMPAKKKRSGLTINEIKEDLKNADR